MGVDKHTLQQWVAGAEVRFQKSRKPLAGIPLVNRIGRLADSTQAYVLTEKIDLTRARDFHAQEATEDMLVASIDLPIFGKRGVGNDMGMAVASFKYLDQEGQDHNLIAICAYTISGVVSKTREVRQVIVIPMA
ncbi:MAG: hypothetical protein ACO1QS_00545 [Verrucomicrobiota bacterium]